jgi:zinc protease
MESIQQITRKDLVNYYKAYFAPNNATMVVVGNVTAKEIVPILEKSLSGWRKKSVPKVKVPAISPLDKTQIYLINKTAAPQSVIMAGHLAPPRNSKDYFKLYIANTILGGKFTSRLNMNLREKKGYTYGASSFFMFLKNLGPFLAYTQVQTKVTKESISEIIKEIRGIRGEIPVMTEELVETKNYITRRYPREFETISQIASKLSEIVTYDLPKNYFNQFIPAVEAVDAKGLMGAMKKHLHPDSLLIVVVGDVEKIEPGIRELSLGKIHHLDAKGNLID